MPEEPRPAERLLRYFASDHLPDTLKRIVEPCQDLALQMARELPATPGGQAELMAGLRKLLEAKDCFVRAGLP
jgi:hypothetical protein